MTCCGRSLERAKIGNRKKRARLSNGIVKYREQKMAESDVTAYCALSVGPRCVGGGYPESIWRSAGRNAQGALLSLFLSTSALRSAV